jgi:hypothetical protein
MARVTGLVDRVGASRSLPELLAAACAAFEVMLTVSREHDQPDGAFFVPMVMAGASAANGRDYLLFAPSLPPLPFSPDSVGQCSEAPRTALEAAAWLAGLCQVIAAQLTGAATSAASSADREACLGAAACAREILALMGGGTP